MDTASNATMVAPKNQSVRPAIALPNWNNTQHKRQQRQIIFHDDPAGRKIECSLIRIPAAQRPEQQKAKNGNGQKKQLLVDHFHFTQFHRRHEPADQHAAPEQRNVFARLNGGHAGHARLAQKIDDGTANGNLPADIHENRQHPEHDVRIFQRTDPRFNFAFTDMRQVDAEKDAASITKTMQNARYGTLTESAPCAPVLAKY